MAAKVSEFRRGVEAAASVAQDYNAYTTHTHQLGDCILHKLSQTSRKKPRRNKEALDSYHSWWKLGFATALAETHRQLSAAGKDGALCAVARGAGLTLKSAKSAGVSQYDIVELRKAGVR